MSLTGRISVDVQFSDTTSSSGVKSLKTITLQDATEYPDGKAAIVSGTVGTTGVELWSPGNGVQFGGYRDAAGQVVTFNSVSRIAVQGSSTSGTVIEDLDLGLTELISAGNQIAVGNHGPGQSIQIRCLEGTSRFITVLYGS